MKKEQYETLSAKEKLLYDELHAFADRMATRLVEVADLLKIMIEKLNIDP